ncbi:hypothetical protein CONCODRAFT_73964 [Conidiobolus coronatus NRRL 28638]|uniref:Uncharacterized protein n=1 Tax=Conidiobolus coronatus (strain ATCC 28846 / CBS 209.66 / NRRL 28638) TaxID=796925 RepID=A0A137NTF6_CONC2|nr:hypothetical protein CONCODRAFT_73964 [Conidiobolus coronatus NRRL 28638]|eukprot:KXN66012.1 hypothetical protein CONCODRAFT_73964 [Conidiobolus coronatus NRRL 28638]
MANTNSDDELNKNLDEWLDKESEDYVPYVRVKDRTTMRDILKQRLKRGEDSDSDRVSESSKPEEPEPAPKRENKSLVDQRQELKRKLEASEPTKTEADKHLEEQEKILAELNRGNKTTC